MRNINKYEYKPIKEVENNAALYIKSKYFVLLKTITVFY